LTWIDNNAVDGGRYTITLTKNETITPKTLSYGGKTIHITLDGGPLERTVNLSAAGSLFTVGSGVTLALGSNVTLRGRNDNTAPVVMVSGGGNLEMKEGAIVLGNRTNTSSTHGGGVHIAENGGFTMTGGTITGNTTTASSGGGVAVDGGSFTMTGGDIYDNYSNYMGGGVMIINGGDFTLSGGSISGNSAFFNDSGSGGGVSVNNGVFTMTGGEISGNTAKWGGGATITNSGSMTMKSGGGTISANTADWGGGVYVNVANKAVFTKEANGVIYGLNAEDALKNTATGAGASGHAVYVYAGDNSLNTRRTTTAGSGVTLNSSLSGSAGGWEGAETVVFYTVTFDADGGSPLTQTRTVPDGGSIGAENMPPDPTKTGYDFLDWYTAVNGSGSRVTASTTITGNITVYARWSIPASVQVTLRPAPEDPALSNTSLFTYETAQFSAGSGYDSYAWYWNGEAIDGAVSSTYNLTVNAKAPGIYELSVVVTSAGKQLSARCRVTIKASY
jgi:uncharacterized repeat protein (TIGR02543 family)